MYRKLAARAAGAALVFLAVAPPAGAWAAGWLSPISGSTMILGFAVPYTGGTHRGVDLAAEAGARVSSPTDGVVTFAGVVPADGGGTCGAVTIELGDGQRVSLLPLDGVSVAEGDGVQSGDSIGAVAAAGDDSSACTHLHVGLRRGDLYLDPGALLVPPAVAEPDGAGQPVVTVQTPNAAATSAAGAPAVAATSRSSAASTVVPHTEDAPIGEAPFAPAAATSVAGGARLLVARRPICDAGVPRPSAVVVGSTNAMSRPSAHLGVPVTRAATGWLLALGMSAVGVSIVYVRRASPVRVR